MVDCLCGHGSGLHSPISPCSCKISSCSCTGFRLEKCEEVRMEGLLDKECNICNYYKRELVFNRFKTPVKNFFCPSCRRKYNLSDFIYWRYVRWFFGV